MIRIVNMRKYVLKPGEILIRVDRTTVLGNPFYMNGEDDRDRVCNAYQKYFEICVQDTSSVFYQKILLIQALSKFNHVALGCWCYPKRCHAQTIKNFVDKLNREERRG